MSDKRFGLVALGHRKLGENTTVAWNAVTPPSVVSVSTQLGEGWLARLGRRSGEKTGGLWRFTCSTIGVTIYSLDRAQHALSTHLHTGAKFTYPLVGEPSLSGYPLMSRSHVTRSAATPVLGCVRHVDW